MTVYCETCGRVAAVGAITSTPRMSKPGMGVVLRGVLACGHEAQWVTSRRQYTAFAARTLVQALVVSP